MEQLFDLIAQDKDQMRTFYQKIMEDPTEEFVRLDRDAEKIRYCYQRLKANNMIIDKGIDSGKNESLALEARNQGNILFIKDKDFVRALEHYNKSICLSLSESENIGICYANRSAIYFESRLYGLSLENIELALSHHYPEKLIPKLKDRQSKCLEKLGSDEQVKSEPLVKLSYHANKRIPSIIEGLEYAKSKEFGRYVRAKHALYPGDIVMIDKPYIKCVNEGSEYAKCNNCLQSHFLNLFPCPNCTKAMYCGSACEQMAWKRFHMYECQVIESDLNRLIIRATLVSFTLFDDCARLKNFIDSIKTKPVTGFDLNYNNFSEEDTLKVIYSLATNASQRSTIDIFKRSNLLAQSWHLLITHTKLRNLLRTTDVEDFFLDTLLHFSQLNATNSHELLHMSRTPAPEIDDYGIYSPQKFGSALFPIISLLNHSCAPNVSRVNSNATIAIMVIRNIKSGEQLFDNYGGDHLRHTREERHAKLGAYLFECKCEACLGDWPLIRGLKMKGLAKFKQVDTGFNKILEYDRAWAVEYFQKCKKFLKEFSHHYPACEVYAAKCILTVSRNILYGNTPLELQLTPHA